MPLKNSPKISVIIPCYNQGQFVDEAIHSVLAQTWQDFEIIVVDDGSTDPFTVEHLQQLNAPKTSIVHTKNQGLPSARNNGIQEALGEYILPLDADDRIGSTYLEQAVCLLDENPDLGIVYCKAQYFGDRNSEWLLPPYSLEEMLLNNIIFCTAFFRRADWEVAGGFDPAMVYGWEDYDFWLSLIERGRQVSRIPEILFYYRIRSDSMLRSKEKKQKVAILAKIFHKHEALYTKHIAVLFDRLVDIKGVYHEASLIRRERNNETRQVLGTRRVDMETKILVFEQVRLPKNSLLEIKLINEQAIISINSVQIKNEKKTVDDVRFESNAVLTENNLHFFNTKEPRLTIHLDASLSFDSDMNDISLIVYLDYLIIGATVPDHIINKLNKEVSAARPMLDTLQQYICEKSENRAYSPRSLFVAGKNILKKILLFCSNRTYRTIFRSGLFDRKFYLTAYPDIFFQETDPLQHYCRLGWRENRKPNASFDPEEYIKTLVHPLPSETAPLLHYIKNRHQMNSAEIE